MRFFLTGFMGCGKSFWREKLAPLLPFPCLDLDERVKEKAGMAISEIFEKHGEPYFRQLEHDELEAILAQYDPVLLALGGGTAVSQKNIEYLKKAGTLIYLETDQDTLIRRLKKELSIRPLLSQLPDAEERIRQLFEAREKFYLQSDWILHPDTLTPATFAEQILQHV